MKLPPSKDQRVETVRGLAILLMVAGHVIGFRAHLGMRVDDDSWWRLGYRTVEVLRLPLFTVISGYVYAMRPVTREQLATFLRGKVRRLLVPLVVTGGAFYVVRALMPGVNDPRPLTGIWRILLFPYAHYWYLQALLVVFALVALVDCMRAMERLPAFFAWLGAAVLFSYSPASSVALFSLSGAAYLLPFFVLGVGLNRFGEKLRAPWVVGVIALLAVLAVGGRQLALLGAWSYPATRTALLSVVGGMALSALLIYRMPTWRPLARLGHYSYGIYLLHVFGSAATRIALHRLGVEQLWLHFVAGMAVGVGAPVVAEWVLDRWGWARCLVFGKRWTTPGRSTATA